MSQAYQQSLPILQANASGYVQLGLTGLDAARGTVPLSDAIAGLRLTESGLAGAAVITQYAVGSDLHKRREKVVADWDLWASQYPASVRPNLAQCQPAEVICFLDHWRESHVGKRSRDAPDVAPTTLRAISGHLSAVMTSLGRCDTWSPERLKGNPAKHPSVASFLKGYDLYCFQEKGYSSSGAVPLTFSKYCQLRDYLFSSADSCADVSVKCTLLRDLCAFSYLWEAGHRGKECSSLLLSDFRYKTLRGTLAWDDIVSGSLDPILPLLVEGSQGTKTQATRHPGVVELCKLPTSGGGGDLIRFLPKYAAAMADSGSPLRDWLFPSRFLSDSTRRAPHISSSALRQRLVVHLSRLQLWEGETLHSFRRGGSQHEESCGHDVAAISKRRQWRCPKTAELYLHPLRHISRLKPECLPADQVSFRGPIDSSFPSFLADSGSGVERAEPFSIVQQGLNGDCLDDGESA